MEYVQQLLYISGVWLCHATVLIISFVVYEFGLALRLEGQTATHQTYKWDGDRHRHILDLIPR